jgi:signal transduction histidine kinase
MRERAVLVGATLSVSRGRTGGAVVRLTLPLDGGSA